MLRSEERGTQAKGIPQVVETPEKFLDLARFIREKILGKPAPEHYDNYEDFVEALNPQEKRRRIDNANTQIVKLARQAIKTLRRAS